jgi:hypothetical protein
LGNWIPGAIDIVHNSLVATHSIIHLQHPEFKGFERLGYLVGNWNYCWRCCLNFNYSSSFASFNCSSRFDFIEAFETNGCFRSIDWVCYVEASGLETSFTLNTFWLQEALFQVEEDTLAYWQSFTHSCHTATSWSDSRKDLLSYPFSQLSWMLTHLLHH